MKARWRRIKGAPLVRVAAIYAFSVPFAWAVTPEAIGWEVVATCLSLALVPVMGLAPWWLAINAVFLPALTASLELEISPVWALVALCTLTILYGRIWSSRVPLFFSSRRALQALGNLLPAGRPVAFLDAGCGDGRVLARLAALRPDSCFHGVEHALGPWIAARVRCSSRENQCKVLRGDLWSRDLAPYDVVYAFLSPAVMERLWNKAHQEMRAGTLLVSAFGVPNVSPDESIDVGDALHTQLHVWRMGSETEAP